MPLLTINTNQTLESDQQQRVLECCSLHVANALGKPERYVMVKLEPQTPMIFGGSIAPCAYLELKSLGLPEEQTTELSKSLCTLLGELMTIPPERIYIEFSNPQRHMWGWNNATF